MFSMKSSIVVVALGALVTACGGDVTQGTNGLTGPSAVTTSLDATSSAATRNAKVAAAASGGADLQISGSASTGSPDAGATLTYTLLVKNSGPDSADAVTVTDTLPAGVQYLSATVPAFSSVGGPIGCTATGASVTCTLGTIAKGGQATITVAVLAPLTAGAFSNTATVSSATTSDPNVGNNSVTIAGQVKTAATTVCALPAGQTTLHGTVMWTGLVATASGTLIQNFAFLTDSGTMYWVRTNFYDGSAPLTPVINLDCKQSPVQFIAVGGSVTVTGTAGTDTVQLTAGGAPVPTFDASVVQVPTHKDKI